MFAIDWGLYLGEVYFVYGLSFILLGGTAWLQPNDPEALPLSRHFPLLGAFGLLHGGNEFLAGWIVTTGAGGAGLAWGDALLLAVSYLTLFEFARRAAADLGRAGAARWAPPTSVWIYVPVVGLALLTSAAADDAAAGLAAGMRYFIAFPAALVAGLAFTRALVPSGTDGPRRAATRALGGAFMAYALLAGLVTGKVAGFPAWLPTHQAFLDVTDIPIQLLRALCALTAMVALSAVVRLAAHASLARQRESSAKLSELATHLERRVEERTVALTKTKTQLAMTHYALDSSINAIAIAGLDGQVQYANPAFAALWDLPSPEAAIGRFPTEFVDPPASAQAVMQALRETGRWEGELVARTMTGRAKDIRLSAFMVRSPDGVPVATMASFLDITEAKAAAAALRREREFGQVLIEAAPVIVLLLSPQGTIQSVNPHFERLTGYRLDEVRGKDWIDTFIPPRDRARIRSLMTTATQGTPTRGNVNAIVTRDGEERQIEWFDAIISDGHGRTISLLAIGHDMTERLRGEEEARNSQAKLVEAQRTARIGSWELDLVGGALVWSDEIYRIFEIDRAKFGASYEAFLAAIHPEDREAVNKAYTDSVASRRPYRIVHRLLLPDNRIKWVEERCRTWYDDAGTALRSAGTVQDITDRTLAEQQLRRSLAEKETLLREIHHRVKNNLQIISSLLYFQAKKATAPEDAAAIVDGRDRLRAMILVHEKLYQSQDLSRIDFGGYVRSLVAQLAQSHAPRGRRIETRVDIGDYKLPIETATPCGMIICELVINAFKHAFPDGRDGTVSVRAASADGRLAITVDDDGAGLPEGFAAGAAGSFGWQLIDNLSAQIDGVVSLARDHGTTVTISLPYHDPVQ